MILTIQECSLMTVYTPLDQTMMGRALEQARRAAKLGEVPVGAVVYRDGDVLAEAHNLRHTQQDPTAHAEIIALRAAAARLSSWRLEGTSLAVTLEPCPMCVGALINGRVGRLLYGAADPKMGCVDSLYQLATDRRFNHRLDVVAGVMANECGEILTRFFEQLRGR